MYFLVNVYFPHDTTHSSVANAAISLLIFPWLFQFKYMPTWFPTDSTCDLFPARILLAADPCVDYVQAGRRCQGINAGWEKSFKTMTDGSWWVNTPAHFPFGQDNSLRTIFCTTQSVIHGPVTLTLPLCRS